MNKYEETFKGHVIEICITTKFQEERFMNQTLNFGLYSQTGFHARVGCSFGKNYFERVGLTAAAKNLFQ